VAKEGDLARLFLFPAEDPLQCDPVQGLLLQFAPVRERIEEFLVGGDPAAPVPSQYVEAGIRGDPVQEA
jgi:hypothetical protein